MAVDLMAYMSGGFLDDVDVEGETTASLTVTSTHTET